MKLSHIAKATGLHIATTQRIAATLVRRGYLRASDAGYTLGPIVLAHAHAFARQDRLSLVAYPILRELTASTGHTSSVYVTSGASRILVARVEAPNPLSYQVPVGQRLGLDIGGGKVLLSQLSEEEQDAFLEHYEGVTLADGRRQTSEDLRADLDSIRASGYYISRSERHAGAASITAPLSDSDGHPSGAVNLVAHEGVHDNVDMGSYRSPLIQAARLIGEQM